jgi:hypothetical protein
MCLSWQHLGAIAALALFVLRRAMLQAVDKCFPLTAGLRWGSSCRMDAVARHFHCCCLDAGYCA